MRPVSLTTRLLPPGSVCRWSHEICLKAAVWTDSDDFFCSVHLNIGSVINKVKNIIFQISKYRNLYQFYNLVPKSSRCIKIDEQCSATLWTCGESQPEEPKGNRTHDDTDSLSTRVDVSFLNSGTWLDADGRVRLSFLILFFCSLCTCE